MGDNKGSHQKRTEKEQVLMQEYFKNKDKLQKAHKYEKNDL